MRATASWRSSLGVLVDVGGQDVLDSGEDVGQTAYFGVDGLGKLGGRGLSGASSSTTAHSDTSRFRLA